MKRDKLDAVARDPQTASPARNFTLTTAERVQAIVTGLPAWARRRKQIEDLSAQILELHRAGEERAAKKKLTVLVSLVDAHNTYYPIEANLPLDPETSRLMEGGTPWKRMMRPTIESLVAAEARDTSSPRSLAWVDDDGGLSVSFDVDAERVTLRLDEESLTCSTRDGETVRVATSRIEEIAGDHQLKIVTFDAETVELPFEIDEAMCTSLATELSARLRVLRAAISNYRGDV